MYGNIRSNLGVGVHTKHVMPRFPVNKAELDRVIGFAIRRAYPAQEASGPLVDIIGLVAGLGITGTPAFRKPVMGIAEQGARTLSSSVNDWSSSDATVLPGTGSFIFAAYVSWDGVSGAVNNAFGVMDAADGAQFIMINPTSGGGTWQFRARDDSANVKSFTKDPRSDSKIARGIAMLYDAADGNVYTFVTGTVPTIQAMGVWAGLSAVGVAAASLRFGGWPSVNGSGITGRYAFTAHGAILDGQGPNLAAIMRRLGWQF